MRCSMREKENRYPYCGRFEFKNKSAQNNQVSMVMPSQCPYVENSICLKGFIF